MQARLRAEHSERVRHVVREKLRGGNSLASDVAENDRAKGAQDPNGGGLLQWVANGVHNLSFEICASEVMARLHDSRQILLMARCWLAWRAVCTLACLLCHRSTSFLKKSQQMKQRSKNIAHVNRRSHLRTLGSARSKRRWG